MYTAYIPQCGGRESQCLAQVVPLVLVVGALQTSEALAGPEEEEVVELASSMQSRLAAAVGVRENELLLLQTAFRERTEQRCKLPQQSGVEYRRAQHPQTMNQC